MKRLNLILLLSAVTVALAFVTSCKETNADKLEKMRGDWVSTAASRPLPFRKKTGNTGNSDKEKPCGKHPDGNVPDTGNGQLLLHRNGAGGDADLRQGERPHTPVARRRI